MRWFRGHADAPRLLSLSPLQADEELEGASLQLNADSRLRDMSPVRWVRRKSSSSESERNCYNVQTSQVTTERASQQKKDKKRIQEERRRSCEKRNPLLDRVKNTRLSFFRDKEVDNRTSRAAENCDDATRIIDSTKVSDDESSARYKSQYRCESSKRGLTRNEFRRSVCEIDLAKQVPENDKIRTKRRRRCKSQSRLPSRKNNSEDRFSFLGFSTGSSSTKSEKRENSPKAQRTKRWTRSRDKLDERASTKESFNDGEAANDDDDEDSIEQPEVTSESYRYDSLTASSCLAAKFRAMQDRYLKSSTSKLIAKIYRKDAKDRDKRRLRSFSYGALPGLEEFRTNPLYNEHHQHHQQDQDDNDSGILDNGSATSSLLDDRCVLGGSPTSVTNEASSLPPDLPPRSSLVLATDTRRVFKASGTNRDSPMTLRRDKRDSQCQDRGVGLSVVKSRPYTTETSVVKLIRESADQCLGIFIAKTAQSSPGYLVAHVVPNGLADREGTLRIGDEILVVNGKRLRGLSMSEARRILGDGSAPGCADIVVSRKIALDGPDKRWTESSVDYENVCVEGARIVANETNLNSESNVINDKVDCPASPKSHFRKHNSRHRRDRKNESGRSISSEKRTINELTSTQQQTVSNFCTLPRTRSRNTLSTFHTVLLEKGHGKKSLGFTIVGGRDSPKGSIGIFIKSVLPGGQAAEDGRLRAGDEILAVNGQVCHDLTHREAVQLFRNIKSGSLALHICRRVKNRDTPMPKAKSCADLLLADDA